jgi:uncharacterized membrane protein YesL
MANPFRALWAALRDLFDEFFMLIVCNLIWVAISGPLFFLAYLLLSAGGSIPAAVVALLAVLPAGPATAGLSAVSYRVSDGRAIKVGDFFAGMRSYARQGWVLMGLFVAGVIIILFNLGFYIGISNLLGGLMLGLWIYLLVFWCSMLIYSFPLLFLQEHPDLRMLARNAALMVVGRPIFTFVTLVLMLIVAGLSAFTVVVFLLITPALLNLWSARATRHLIEVAEARRAALANKSAEVAPIEEKGRKGQVRPK